MIYFTLLSSRKSIMFCKRERTWCRDGNETENSNWPTPIFSYLYTFFLHFRLKMSPLHTFSKNELHLICSTFPTIVPLSIDVLKRQTLQFLLGIIFLCVAPVSNNTEWMILVLKQSVLTQRYSSGGLLLHVLKYTFFHRYL